MFVCLLLNLFNYQLLILNPPEKKCKLHSKTDKELKEETLPIRTSTNNRMNQMQNKTPPSISSSSICRLVSAVITSGQTITMTVFTALRKLILSVEGPDPALHAAINKMWHPHTQPCHPSLSCLHCQPVLHPSVLETIGVLELKLYS